MYSYKTNHVYISSNLYYTQQSRLLFFQNVVTQITSLFLDTLSEPMSESLHDVAKHLWRNDCFLCQIHTFNFLPLFMAVTFSNDSHKSTMADEMLYKGKSGPKANTVRHREAKHATIFWFFLKHIALEVTSESFFSDHPLTEQLKLQCFDPKCPTKSRSWI